MVQLSKECFMQEYRTKQIFFFYGMEGLRFKNDLLLDQIDKIYLLHPKKSEIGQSFVI